MKKDLLKNILLWVVIAILLAEAFNLLGSKPQPSSEISYSNFLSQVDSNKISAVTITNKNYIVGQYSDGKMFESYVPVNDPNLLPKLIKQKVDIVGRPPEQRSVLMQILLSWAPLLIIFAIWIFIIRQQTGGGKGGAFSFGRSRARLLGQDQVKETFADVAGCDEAKEEVSELVEFLRDPGKFQKLGGRIPRGVLLIGAPGTGKTLLAKAVAGEAKVPFFSIAGSDFVEMFVGVGASRVRDMFEQAKKQAPCIIFIDELDAVGRHRGAGLGGGHDEREQTLNQMLVEMDGFEGKEGIIVLAATNRPDVLDPALLRPGRFDRQVVVPLPDVRGREQILNVHLKKIALGDDVKPNLIARGTPGFSGADLANLANEAALFAARANKDKVGMLELERAKDKIIMGAERRSMVMNDKEKTLTAYHESGHVIVGRLVPEHDPIYKVSIIPRGRALGLTMFLPEEDRYSLTRLRIESQIAGMFGGRIAEELIFGADQITTGASNDIEQATKLARKMVTQWGLSETMGPILYGEEEREVFLGQSLATRHKEISDNTAEKIDVEVRKIIDRNYAHAERILSANLDILRAMSDALIKYETLDKDQIDDLMTKKPVKPPKDWVDSSLDSGAGNNTATATEVKIEVVAESNKDSKEDNVKSSSQNEDRNDK